MSIRIKKKLTSSKSIDISRNITYLISKYSNQISREIVLYIHISYTYYVTHTYSNTSHSYLTGVCAGACLARGKSNIFQVITAAAAC